VITRKGMDVMSKLAGLGQGPIIGIAGAAVAATVGAGLYLGGFFAPERTPDGLTKAAQVPPTVEEQVAVAEPEQPVLPLSLIHISEPTRPY